MVTLEASKEAQTTKIKEKNVRIGVQRAYQLDYETPMLKSRVS